MKALVTLIVSLTVAGCALNASASEPQPFLRGSWAELRQDHAGRPTIVHFWGLTCGPCLAELPKWGEFAHAHDDVDFVFIDADPIAVAPEDLAATLNKAGLGSVESWRFADAFTERLEYEIDPQWRGEMPYTLLIGRDGVMGRILGTVDFARLARWGDAQNRHAMIGTTGQ